MSKRANVEPTEESALSGFINNIAVIIILKICSVLPDMYIMKAFMGMLFAGASAISQAFFRKRSSVSAGFAVAAPDCLPVDLWVEKC